VQGWAEILALGPPLPAHRVPGHFLTGKAPPVSLIQIPQCRFEVKHHASNALSVCNSEQRGAAGLYFALKSTGLGTQIP